MNERVRAELEWLRTGFPDAEFLEDVLWARIPSYPLPEALWGRSSCELAFRVVLPGQPPYGFWVRPGLSLLDGRPIQNYSYPVATGFGEGWGQFSWGPEEWVPRAAVRRGANMLVWARSFALRLAEGA